MKIECYKKELGNIMKAGVAVIDTNKIICLQKSVNDDMFVLVLESNIRFYIDKETFNKLEEFVDWEE